VRVVLDTNVFVSGVFFAGPPSQILQSWRDEELTVVVSHPIMAEYHRVGRVLAARFDGMDLDPLLALVTVRAEFVESSDVAAGATEDPDDDKFLAAALLGAVDCVISGDKHLLRASGWRGIEVRTPRRFVDEHLRRV